MLLVRSQTNNVPAKKKGGNQLTFALDCIVNHKVEAERESKKNTGCVL